MRTERHALTNRSRTAKAARLILTATALTLALATATARLAAGAPMPYLDLPGGEIVPLAPAESLRIVINVPDRLLHRVEGERLVASYPVAVGRPATPTPSGSFRILQMAKDPTWAPKGGPIVPPGPRNPLGTRWMRITTSGYGIHATNDPGSIGGARSHGCIRMHRADAEAVFAQVQRGTRVDIVDPAQP
ncbi:MAG: L,D-transpeptidase [Candidatus Eisenbacteria bacterium]